MKDYVNLALDMGFSNAAVMKVKDLTVVPAYRQFCVENLCGNYNKLPACPPESGTVEEMVANMNRFENALILQTELEPANMEDAAEHRACKKQHNIITEDLLKAMQDDGCGEILMMGAGPWKKYSCMSAYCVDAQKMADACGMICWGNDGKVRYFSLLLFH